MSAPKSKSIPNHDSTKGKPASTNVTPGATTPEKDYASGGKPDKKVYEAEQAKLKAEIDVLQTKMSAIRDKIGLATAPAPGNDKRNTLRAELDSIREKQMSNKNSRGKILDQIKALQAGIQKKNTDIQSSKSKIPFKTVGDLDSRIQFLDKQVESGTMKVADEKRALQEINGLKRSRRTLESFQAEYDAIEKDRTKIDELRKELDDPAAKALSDRYEGIKAELDDLKRESNEAYAGRTKLFEERDSIQDALDALFTEKRQSAQRYREANERHRNKVNEERARRVEKQRQQRAAEEAQKKKDIAERLLEEAQVPAYQAQIEDCQTLIDYLSGKTSSVVSLKSGQLDATVKTQLAGVPKLEVRKVEEVPEGLIPMKKKGEEEEAYYVGRKGKAKSKKTLKVDDAPGTPSTAGSTSSSSFNVPLPTLTALLTLSIPPPSSNADLPRVVEDLKTKKAWFEANQARQTAENIAKAQAQIKKLDLDVKDTVNGGTESSTDPGSLQPDELSPVAAEVVESGAEPVEGQVPES